MSGYHQQEDERVHHVLSQETIDRALAEDAARRQGGSSGGNYSASSHSSHSHSQGASYNDGPAHPGITRKDTTTRRDPITGDLIEEYSGKDESGPAMRAHYNWDEPGKAPNTTGGQYSSGGTYGSSHAPTNPPRPGEVRRTNTTISYDSSGNRVEEHDGEGSLGVRALYNDDEDSSSVYNPNSGRPQGPPRHQSEQHSRRY